ncbi:MAG: TasA family protein [Dehalococcoidales bacterium]|nr:TasA family protein [Dehalococcoidales bacterium]
MKRKIIGMVAAISVVAVLLGTGTWALFSDTETSTGNVFTAGTIDLEVNDKNPWDSAAVTTELDDLKPCMTGTVTIILDNVGTNPFHVWKIIKTVSTADGTTSEPETDEENGSPANDIDSVIRYSMDIDDVPLITEAENFTISAGAHHLTGDNATTAVKEQYIYLGTIAAEGTMKVEQYYHMDRDTTNWAQGDTMTFTIEFYALQTEGDLTNDDLPTTQLTGHALDLTP